MKKLIPLVVLIGCAVVSGDRASAATNSALGCLQASAQSGGLATCLGESEKGATTTVPAERLAARAGTASSLSIASLDAGEKKISTIVPTPIGWTSAEEGTLKAGFYNGLDIGFKTAFMAIEYLPILGIEASGAPYRSNAGTIAFTALGVLLAIPASIIGVVLGAPLGARSA